MSTCCCKNNECQPKREAWVIGEIETPAGKVPILGTRLTFHDVLGALKVRFAIGRHTYTVQPGLYAIGKPTAESPVFVSANYKLSFDHLRYALGGTDGWVMVLDTQGINVWCAAGKGTFGTEEIVNRVQQTKLDQVVTHRKLIVPQLGAPGVSAPEVARQCGFSVVYGPVRAEDIPFFLENNFTAIPEMRRVRFALRDRIAVIPVELIIWFKQALILAAVLALLSGFSRDGYSLAHAPHAFGLVFAAWLTGGAIVPMLLPFIPGHAFSLKGVWAGLLLWVMLGSANLMGTAPLIELGWGMLITAIVSFMALNFTGTSTYTSMSGVKKEMKIAIPLQLVAVLCGTVLIVLGGLS
ncbi:MAG: acetyl-CoA synthase subunit gamma [Kiritimatiellaeota bacterium]|nr:acetyl-CoA synthase subunit gamma [Kiritimatiellota bacterium]